MKHTRECPSVFTHNLCKETTCCYCMRGETEAPVIEIARGWGGIYHSSPYQFELQPSIQDLYAQYSKLGVIKSNAVYSGKIKTCSAWYIKCLESNISTLCETVKCLKVISSTMSNSVLSVHRKGAVVFFLLLHCLKIQLGDNSVAAARVRWSKMCALWKNRLLNLLKHCGLCSCQKNF